MEVQNLIGVQLAVSEAGVKVEKQLEFLADALESKIDYDGHEEVAEVLFPLAALLRAISEKTHQDFEALWGAIHSLQERMRKSEPA